MPDIKTLEIPLEGGLDQKTDVLWLQPGSIAASTNLVHQKHGSAQKRQGLQALTNAWTASFRTPPNNTLTGGRRLGSIRGTPVLAGAFTGDFAYSIDGLFTYQDSYGAKQWVLQDLLPEAYLYPYETYVSWSASISEMDSAIANGVRCVVFSSGGNIYYTLRSAVDGSVLAPPSQITSNASTFIPKVIVCGKFFVITWSNQGNSNIEASLIDSTAPITNVSITRINTTSGDSLNNISGSSPNPYDICPVIGDTTKMGLIYERTNAGVRTILIEIITVATLTISSSATVNGSDSTWTTDNGVSAANGQLTGLALRIDSGISRASFTYGWRNATTTHATFGSFTYSGLVAVANSIDLYGTPGPTAPSTDLAPNVMGVELSGNGNHVVRLSPGKAVLDQGSSQLPYIASWQVTVGSTTIALASNQPRVTFGATLWSRDLPLNGISYFVGYVPSTTQGSFFLFADDSWQDTTALNTLDSFPARLVGNIAPRLSSALVPTVAAPLQSRVATHIAANPYASGRLVYEVTFSLEQSVSLLDVGLVAMDFNSALTHQNVELGQNLCFANGRPSAFDGSTAFELGFPYYPVIVSGSGAGAAGFLSAGTYLYIAVYFALDSRGQAHPSGRSAPFSVTVAANNTVTLKIATMGYSSRTRALAAFDGNYIQPQALIERRPNVLIKLYRTQVGGSLYTNVIAGDGFIATNVQNAATVTVTDGASDASIAPNAALYGDGSDGTQPGNLLDNLCPPAFQGFIVHNNRLFGIDGPRIWPSKEFTTGQGSGFHEEMAFSVDDGPGPVVAGASMDDKLILFKSDRLFYVTGLGPADNGQDNDFSQPQRIASDVGCIDWRGVVSSPQGVFFQSPAGRRLLTRDLQVVPVPAVEDVDKANPVVTGALIHPSSGRIIFTENTDDVTAPRIGTVLHDDYVVGAWTQANYNDGAGHAALGFVSVVVANAITAAGPPVVTAPTLHLLRADGTVVRESSSSNFDTASSGGANLFVGAVWTSPWIKADGLQGWGIWQAVRIAFQQLDASKIQVQIAYDGDPTPTDTFTFTNAQIATMGPLAIIALEPTNERAATMQITISDASDGVPTTGAGFRLQSVRVDYGFEPGGFRAPIAQQA